MSDTFDKLREALAGRYDVKKQVGEGGMATVYLAWDTKHKREVAIKALKPELSATIGTERFNREIEVAARLQHPHILPVYDSGDAQGVLYYVMPFVKGESLKEYAARSNVDASDALRITREVASALDYAHREGVVHRDIKPANILISQGHAVVADFGIARAVSNSGKEGLTSVGMAVGTPWYMSPEQATADPNVDGRSDIYALGCVLFELLEGKPPFDGDTAQAVIAKTISAPMPEIVDLAGRVPDSVPAAIKKALEKDPKERFATAAEFATALDVSTGEFVGGARAGSKKWLGVAAAAGAVTAVGLTLALTRADGAVASGADLIAVLPFDVSGASAELGEGMVNLLSTNLDAAGEVQTVDARTVLQRWRARGGEAGLDLEGSLEVARDANAGSVLLGSVVAVGNGVRLNAEMYATDGEELARVQIEGDADNVFQLVDSLSLEILRAIWRSNEPVPSFDVAAVTSGSLEAVRAYMRGTLHFRHGQFDSAVVAFQEAVEIDSTFALAQLALSEGYGWTGRHGSQVQRDAVATAFRFADRLPPRDRLLVQAYHLNRQNDRSSLDSIKRYTELYPSDPRGWYGLGDFQFHGMTDQIMSPEEQLEPFDRAIELDSSMVAALVHPMEISLLAGFQDRFETYSAINQAAGGDDRGLLLAARLVWGDDEEIQAAMDTLLGGSANPNDLAVAAGVVHNPQVVPQLLEALRPLMEEPGSSGFNFSYLGSQIALMIGDLERYEEILAKFESNDEPNIQALGYMLRLLAVLGGAAEPSFAEPAVSGFGALQGDESERYLRALIALAHGDAPRARELIGNAVINDGAAGHRRVAMDGWLMIAEGDSLAGIERLRNGVDSLPPPNLGGNQLDNSFRLALARALAARADTREEGLRMLRYGFDMRTAPDVNAIRLLALAQALEAAGDIEAAILALSDFVDVWGNADPRLQPRVEAARAEIDRLNGIRN